MIEENKSKESIDPSENGEETVERNDKGQFVEGNKGGPGRPEGSVSITSAIKRKLEVVPEGETKTYLQAIIDKIFKKALMDEDTVMIKQIWAYVDGMPKQGITLGVDDTVESVTIEIVKNATKDKEHNSIGEEPEGAPKEN